MSRVFLGCTSWKGRKVTMRSPAGRHPRREHATPARGNNVPQRGQRGNDEYDICCAGSIDR
ncbi:MAG TPA: hypothetical protein VEV19_11480 [Ktedonobacteraceae bacterium]|nr:hypothetical protein [Ktedonobacteraceae bacterium]